MKGRQADEDESASIADGTSYKNGEVKAESLQPLDDVPTSDEMFQLQLQQLQRPGGVLVALVALASLATLAGSSPSPLSAPLFPSPNAVPVSGSHGTRAAASPASPDQHNWLGRRANVPIPDPASRVDLFIGTTSTGHAFPGEPPPSPPLSVWLAISTPTCGRF